MGYSVTVRREAESGTWVVAVRDHLTRAETNDLFLSGDSMVSWPVDGLQWDEDPRLQRSVMFVSEVAARPQGLELRYREEAHAGRAAALLRTQLGQIGIREET